MSTDREPQCRIEASRDAVFALQRLADEYGELILHLPGGTEEAGTPICLQAGELLIGPQDVFLGRVEGVDVYEQRNRPGRHFRTGYVMRLELVPGIPPGFSLLPGDGVRFAFRDSPGPGSGAGGGD